MRPMAFHDSLSSPAPATAIAAASIVSVRVGAAIKARPTTTVGIRTGTAAAPPFPHTARDGGDEHGRHAETDDEQLHHPCGDPWANSHSPMEKRHSLTCKAE